MNPTPSISKVSGVSERAARSLAVAFVVVLVLFLATVLKAQPTVGSGPEPAPDRAPIIEADQSIRTGLLPRRLQPVPGKPPIQAERDALLRIFRESPSVPQSNPDRKPQSITASLEAHLERWPRSRFGPSIRENLASMYERRTIYSKALAHWSAAEQGSHGATETVARFIHDRAVARRALLLARLGQLEAFEDLSAQIGEQRLMGGEATDAWLRAMEIYKRLEQDPGRGFRCGVFALAALADANSAQYDRDLLMAREASPEGMSIQDLLTLAKEAGFPIRAIRRVTGQTLPVPSVLHYQGDHFVALVAREGDRVKISDPSLGRRMWVDLVNVNQETTGFALTAVPHIEPGWELLSSETARRIMGRSTVCLVMDNEDGPLCVPGRGASTTSEQGASCSTCPSSPGMASWRVSEPFLNLWIEDTPLSYTPARGPEMDFTLSHRQRVGDRPNTMFQETSFGYGWHCNWLSEVDTGGNGVTVGHPGGRLAWYEFIPSSATLSEPNYWDHCRVEKLFNHGSQIIGYRLHRPDGSQWDYESMGPNGEYFLSRKTSPIGDSVSLAYDTSHRLNYVEDASGNRTYLRYQHPGNINLVTRLDQQMRVDGVVQTVRTVTFGYFYSNGAWHLTAITDAAGIVSRFTYDLNHWVSSMSTPYGTTRFAYTEVETAPAFQRSVVITEPEGLSSAYLLIDATAPGMPETFQRHQYPATGDDLDGLGPGTLGFPAHTLDLPRGTPTAPNTARNQRNTFYWNPLQWGNLGTGISVTQLDWRHLKQARIRHWLWEEQSHIDTLSYEQAPSPDGNTEGQLVFYDYANKPNTYTIGNQILPSMIAQKLPDGTIAYTSYQRNSLGNITSQTETYTETDGTIGLRTRTLGYAANEIDLLSESDFAGATIRTNSYNTQHQLLTTTAFPVAGTSYTTTFTYDAQDRLATLITPTGLTRTFTYGSDGYLAESSDSPISRTNSFTWENGEIKTHTNVRGFTRTFTFDALGRPTRVDYPDGTHEAFGYTANGLGGGSAILDLTWQRDREGNVTEYRFDGLGRMSQHIDALNQTNTFDYCDCGALEGITDALGHLTSFSHDYQGNRTSITHPNNEGVIDLGYNSLGQLTSQTNALSTRFFYYNNQGLLTTVSNAVAGVELSVTYDINDQPIVVTDAHGVTVTNTFDQLGRLVTRTDPNGGVETFTYTARGLTNYEDQTNLSTQYTNDEAARRTRVTTPNLEEIDYSYNDAGDLLTLTDGKDQLTSWGYDIEGRMISKTNAASQAVLQLGYNAIGQVTSRTNALSVVTSYTYDAVGSLKTVDYSDSTPDVRFTYDARHDLASMNDGFGLTTFTNTPSGLFQSEDGPLANDLVSYEYNGAGLRSKLTLAQATGAWVQDYVYDGAERLSSLTSPAGTFGYVYPTGSGNLAKSSWLWERLDLPGGHDIHQAFDGLARLTQNELEDDAELVLNRHSYQFNDRHQRTKQTFLAGNFVDYGYDSNGQLTSATGKESDQTPRLHEQLVYDYDDAWNLAQRDRNQLVATLTANNRNELTSSSRSGTATVSGMARAALATVEINGITGEVYADNTYARGELTLKDGSNDLITKAIDTTGQELNHVSLLNLPGNLTYTYDAGGNLLSDGTRNFTYDGENRLIRYEEIGKAQHLYTYDGFGRMRQRMTSLWSSTQPGWQTVANVQFIYDGMNVIQERDASNGGARLVSYTRGLDLSGSFGGAGGIGGLLSYTDHTGASDRTAFYHADGNGNVTAMINSAGRVVAQYHYDPYGNLLGMAGPLADLNRYRYSSKEAQPYAELYYYGLRFYDPSLQRWINQDPIGEAGGINLYGFVGNDPINRVDPFGLYFGVDDLVFAGGGALVGLGGQLVGDLIGSYRKGKLRFSGWEDYAGAGLGGAVGGVALIYTGPIGAGLAGGAAGNLTKQFLKNQSGKQCGYDPHSFVFESAVGGLTGFVPGVRIPGISAGRGSYNQVYKQVVTKARKGTISKITPRTARKMFGGRAIDTGLIPGAGAGGAAGAVGSGFIPPFETVRPPQQ